MSSPDLPDTLIIVCAHAVYVGPSSASILKSTRESSAGGGDGGGGHSGRASGAAADGAGAAAVAGEELSNLPGDDEENEWYLESFQMGEAATFVRHVEEGVRLHAECLGERREESGDGSRIGNRSGREDGRGNESRREFENEIEIEIGRGIGMERGKSLLVFSGGAVKTGLVHRGVKGAVGERIGKKGERIRLRAGDGEDRRGIIGEKMEGRTEAGGYMALAKARNYFGFNARELEDTVLAEEYSTDSFQNVLFGLIVYYKLIAKLIAKTRPKGSEGLGELPGQGFDAGRDPLKKLIIVSHAFKEPRFMHLHLKTLRFPTERVEFVGIDPPWTGERREDMVRGERERGYKAWEEDEWGIGAFLSGKRRERGWDADLFVREMLREGWEGAERWRVVFEKLVLGEDFEERGLPWEERSG